MSEKLFIGFDTSNYTTSLAVCDISGKVLGNFKCPLPVKEGQRGLRQSEAVFAHIKNFPLIAGKLKEFLGTLNGNYEYVAAAVSSTPRSVEGSYMPCFLSGLAVAESVCAFLDIPLYETSHQVGHVIAATASALQDAEVSLQDFLNNDFLALHVSGGTTDLLYVKPNSDNIISIERIGGSSDANAGQIIDRTGIRMGFSFPCGPYIDESSLMFSGKIKGISTSVKGLEFNLSGLENLAEKMINEKVDTSEVSAFVLEYISKSIYKSLNNAFDIYGKLPVVFAGGVMSSKYIKRRLSHIGLFSEPQYSADNAAGVAIISLLMHTKNKQFPLIMEKRDE